MSIGRGIKIILKAAKLTRRQMAERLGISRAYLSTLENNKVSGGNMILQRITQSILMSSAFYVVAASSEKFRKEFPGTSRNIKRRVEILASQSVTQLENKPAA